MVGITQGQLQVGFYRNTCPNAESIVTGVVSEAAQSNPSYIPQLLRLHFHDCFVEIINGIINLLRWPGCDGSILIDGGEDKPSAQAGVEGFNIIDSAKEQLKATCPGVVSCSDIYCGISSSRCDNLDGQKNLINMPPTKLRKAIGAVKDQTTISLALVGGSSSLSDLEVAIVKATSHDEIPSEEKYIREILSLTCYSRSYVGACISLISKRLSKTKTWVVALKTLMLVQRLLGDGDPAYEQEIFFATRRGTRLLNMSDFRDTSRSNSWDFSAFVRTYALYLDEQLEVKMASRKNKRRLSRLENDEEGGPTPVKNTPVRDMSHERLFSRVQHLMQLLDRFLACRPRGSAQDNRVVLIALYPVVKDSFQIYYDITEILGLLIERFTSLEISDTVKVYEIFSRIAKQFEELDAFYDWCKHVGIARSSEYPEVEKITQKKLEVMDEFIQNSSTSKHKVVTFQEPKEEIKVDEDETDIVEEDMNSIKALPPPEGFCEEEKKVDTPKAEEEEKLEEKANVKEPDLLDLSCDTMTSEQQGDKLALALFDGGALSCDPNTSTQPWEAYETDTENWETALVQSTSHLANQKMSLPGGFDTLVLDGMYQQGAMVQAMSASGVQATGSASSVAFGSAGRPAMLALPAPPTADGGGTVNSDPFAASLAVPPPSYVQMSEMEKKQKLLVEEQMLWQQYGRDGNLQQSPYHYNPGGYTRTY